MKDIFIDLTCVNSSPAHSKHKTSSLYSSEGRFTLVPMFCKSQFSVGSDARQLLSFESLIHKLTPKLVTHKKKLCSNKRKFVDISNYFLFSSSLVKKSDDVPRIRNSEC